MESKGKLFQYTDNKKVENILSQYPDNRSATLPLLHLAQDQLGYISTGVINAVAKLTETHPAELMDCVSFYSMYYLCPQGKYKLQVCQTLSCSLNGADNIVDHISKKYKIKPGETSTEGKFTLMKVECLGSCGTAPVVQINNDYHEGLTIPELDELLENVQ